ncbi:beta-galactosidase [Candidatus Neomarinimicrobiota bacterium]
MTSESVLAGGFLRMVPGRSDFDSNQIYEIGNRDMSGRLNVSRSIIIFMSIMVLFQGFASLVSGAGPNLVPNPSFENFSLKVPPINFQPTRPALDDDPAEYVMEMPDHWNIVGAYSRGYLPREQGWGLAQTARTGKHSIFLSSAPAFPAWYSDDFALNSDAAHMAEVFIDPTKMGYKDYTRLIFSILDKDGNCLGYEQIVSARIEDRNIRSNDYGHQGWRKKQLYIPHYPGQAKMRIIIRLSVSGEVLIDDIAVTTLSPEEAIDMEPPYKQITPELKTVRKQPKVKGTGYYCVQEVNDVWWLIDPEGQLTWSIGVQSMGNVLWENPGLTKYIEENYAGDQSRYLEAQLPRLRRWNFTTSGSWSGEAFYKLNNRLSAKGAKPFPSFQFIGYVTVGDQEYSVRNRDGIVNDFGEHAMVDPFNPDWRRKADAKVKEVTSLYQNTSWLVGYFVDNEINFRNLTQYLHSSYCSQELVRWLSEQYVDDISALNSKWSTAETVYSYGSFDEIRADIPDQDPAPPVDGDLRAFVRHMVKTYIDFTVDTIHKYDPNHIIVSNRFALGSKARALGEIGDFADIFSSYDIVCVNLYAGSGGSYAPDQMALLQYLHEQTARPLLIGEYSFHANESNIPLDRWGGKIVATMVDRGEAYNRTMISWAYLPYMVGAHFYKWCNGYGPVGRYRGRNAGLVQDNNEPYQVFVDMVTKTNLKVLMAKRQPNGSTDDFKYSKKNESERYLEWIAE